jgi:hypothetical protein
VGENRGPDQCTTRRGQRGRGGGPGSDFANGGGLTPVGRRCGGGGGCRVA